MSIILAAILFVVVLQFFLIAYIFFRISRVYNQIRSFVTPEAEGKPSPLANTSQIVADMVGRSIVATIKSTFMSKQSGEARALTAIQGDLAEGALGASPLGALLGSFPALKKTLRRNPALVDMALSAFQKGNNGQNNGSSSDSSQTQFKL
jgi:mannose/fructose/N-acetylgalactosamine-specific phosphotransferase system component IID